MNILVVDDVVLNCKLLEAILNEYYKCECCKIALSGNDAIELFEESLNEDKPFDLVCLDIMMPGKDGYEVLHEMRNLEQKFPQIKKKSRIIMVTALDENADKVKAFHEDCDGYLIKPIEKNLLTEMLKKMSL